MCDPQMPEQHFQLKGEAEDSDDFAVQIAKRICRRLLQAPNLSMTQILGLARALYALERLPVSTPWVFVEYGVCYRMEGMFDDMHYVDFRITSDTFEIIPYSLLDHGIGRDAYWDPRWSFDVYGNREADCQLSDLEERVIWMLEMGGEIRVDDESDAPK